MLVRNSVLKRGVHRRFDLSEHREISMLAGRFDAQEYLLCRFRIGDHVPRNRLLRRIDWRLDFGTLRPEPAALTEDASIRLPRRESLVVNPTDQRGL